jgi:hypothetical protein
MLVKENHKLAERKKFILDKKGIFTLFKPVKF